MRHIGHILVLIYSVAVGLFMYGPLAAGSSGLKESGPWVAAVVICILFALTALVKVGKSTFKKWAAQQADEISIDEFDVPDVWLFGLFAGFVAINLVAHFFLAAMAEVSGTIWYVAWIVADILVLAVSYVIFKVTAKAKLQAATARPRSINRSSDAA